jgi:hypothetical protein
VVSHERQREGARKGDRRRKLSRKKIDHDDGKGSKDQGNDTQIPFRLGKRVKQVSQNEKKGWVKESWILFIEVKLISKPILRILEGINFVYPEGFLVKRVKSHDEPYDANTKQNQNFFMV